MNKDDNDNQIIIELSNQENNEKVADIYFKDSENRNGKFIIYVPSQIDLISFSNLIMYLRSTFNVKRRNENRRNIHQLDEGSVVVQVENSININSESIVTLSNIYLIGRLNIYDDSLLTMNEKSNFSEQSKVNVIIQRSKSYSSNDKQIIYVGQSLNSKPKSIILSSGPNNDKIDITDMPIIGSETFNGFSKWYGVFKFQDGKNGDISISCKTNNNIKTLLLTAKEKERKKNKLGAGAIAGIVIACVAVIAIAIVVTIILLRRKRNDDSDTERENNSDVSDI